MEILFSIAVTLFFVIDAPGNIPTYLKVLKVVPPSKRKLVEIRELVFSLLIMFCFNYLGKWLLTLLTITKNTVQISGGILLLLIALRLIFERNLGNGKNHWGEGTPFIVPIATPLIAGPSVLTVIMVFSQERQGDLLLLSAIFLAWAVSSVILLCAPFIYKLVGEKVLIACQRLMGLIVALIAVQTFLQGLLGLLGEVAA